MVGKKLVEDTITALQTLQQTIDVVAEDGDDPIIILDSDEAVKRDLQAFDQIIDILAHAGLI